jgi:hypothetical protein
LNAQRATVVAEKWHLPISTPLTDIDPAIQSSSQLRHQAGYFFSGSFQPELRALASTWVPFCSQLSATTIRLAHQSPHRPDFCSAQLAQSHIYHEASNRASK